jgi:hypothetical protein
MMAIALREPDRFLEETVAAARENLERCVSEIRDCAQQQPEKALLGALATGCVLRVLPLSRLVRTCVRLGFAMLKPAVVIYGGAKLWQMLQDRGQANDSDSAGAGGDGEQNVG